MVGSGVAVAVGGGDVWVAVAGKNGVEVSDGVVAEGIGVGDEIAFEGRHPLRRRTAAIIHEIAVQGRLILREK